MTLIDRLVDVERGIHSRLRLKPRPGEITLWQTTKEEQFSDILLAAFVSSVMNRQCCFVGASGLMCKEKGENTCLPLVLPTVLH